MARTPHVTRSGAHLDFSVRLPPELASWLYSVAREQDTTLNAIVSDLIEGRRTLWDLPDEAVKVLREEAKVFQLKDRDYIRCLFAKRYRQVRAKGIAFDKKQVDQWLAEERKREPKG